LGGGGGGCILLLEFVGRIPLLPKDFILDHVSIGHLAKGRQRFSVGLRTNRFFQSLSRLKTGF
jgi:hypothetical protein